MSKDKTSKDELARIIKAMPYGELITVCQTLCNMRRMSQIEPLLQALQPSISRLETKEDFAGLLHAWAEAHQ